MEGVERVDAALESHDVDALEEAVRTVVRDLDDIDTYTLGEVCEQLAAERAFDALGRLADAAVSAGRGGRFWVDLVQSHIEQGTYATATAIVETALGDPSLDGSQRRRLRGQRGRISKERFLIHRQADDLRAAIDAYATGVREGGDLLWLGINAHALAHLARRQGIDVPPLGIPSEHEVMRAAEAAMAGDDDWAEATWIESHLLIGLPVPVDSIATRLADSTPFVQASMRRQLMDVWGLADDHPAIVTLSEFLLRSGAAEEIELPADRVGYEKLFGSEWPVAIDTYRRGLRAAESVCHIMIQGQVPIGTGFVVDGSDLHPVLAQRRVILTNEHVVPSPEHGDGAPAEAISAHFDAHDGPPVGGFSAVWWSNRTDLDVAILVSDALDGTDLPGLVPGTTLPPVMPGAHVYVVGHPGGRSLSMSIRGNDLIDHDGVRIHYRAPTEKGSSGSPVFDQGWNLIGVHHFGSSRLPKLHHQPGTYGGNEGTTIGALRLELCRRVPTP